MNNNMYNHLLEYKGQGKKPEDFDSFWKDELEKAIPAENSIKIRKVDIVSNIVNCYELNFISHDGTNISCQLLKPKNIQRDLPGILLFHGYHTNSGDYSDKVGLAAEGNIVLAMDCRGQGGVSEYKDKASKGTVLKGLIIRGVEQGPEYLYYKDLYLDTVLAARVLRGLNDVDANNISVQGSSQGGALALVCASLETNIKRVLVHHPFLCDYRKAYELDVQNSAYEELFYWFKFRDPLHEREDEFFDTLEYIDVQHFTSRIKAKVIMVTGMEDKVCFPTTQFAAFNNIRSQKDFYVLPEYGHEHYPKIADKLRGFIINED